LLKLKLNYFTVVQVLYLPGTGP